MLFMISGVSPMMADRLPIGAVGEIETLQPVVGRGKADPGFDVARMQLDRAAEMLLGEPEIGGAEVLLAETEIVVRISCRASAEWRR